MKEQKRKSLDMHVLNKKARKRILLIAVIGGLLLMIDFVLAFSNHDVKLVEQNGKLYMMRPEETEQTGHLSLYASVTAEEDGRRKEIKQSMEIALEPYENEVQAAQQQKVDAAEMTESERIAYELRNMAGSFNSDRTLRAVELPMTLNSGEKISWEIRRHNNAVVILMVMLLLMAAVYKTRLKPLEKQRQKEQTSIVRQLPEFVNRLVLLLNAGLVLNSAFEKSVEESRTFGSNQADYFYRRMQGIYESMQDTNSVMHLEFRRFAKESGTRELMRISNIISDNISKGVELTEKLERESEILWLNRKKNCEEKGRMAETALTLPLVIFLMVLVVISVSPALLEL